jgi:hypothetical protein
MRCNPSARWGPGTTKEKQSDSESAKELKQKMEIMMKEREKQNSMWSNKEESVTIFSSKAVAPVTSFTTTG